MTVLEGTTIGAADWGLVDAESRLTVPSEVTACVTWFSLKQRMKVSIDLSRPRMIIVRNLADVAVSLSERRHDMLQDSEDEESAQRRIALTYHFFREATFIGRERRIGLKSVILEHLETQPGGRLFCIAFAERIEAYNESAAREIISHHSADIVLR